MGEIDVRGDARMRIGGEKKPRSAGLAFIYVQGAWSYSLLLFFCATAIPPACDRELFAAGARSWARILFPLSSPSGPSRVKVCEEYVVQKRM